MSVRPYRKLSCRSYPNGNSRVTNIGGGFIRVLDYIQDGLN